MAYLGKADELQRWSSELRSLQLPQLPSSLTNPWQLMSKDFTPEKPSSASQQSSATEEDVSAKQQLSGRAHSEQETHSEYHLSESSPSSSGAQQSDVKSSSVNSPAGGASSSHSAFSTARRGNRASAKAQGFTVVSDQEGEKNSENPEHAATNNHAQHLWSSWLRWQDRCARFSRDALASLSWCPLFVRLNLFSQLL